MSAIDPTGFELRFQHLLQHGRGFAFPCDARGRVNLDALSVRARNNYFYARALIGRELALPVMVSTRPAS